MPAQWHPGPTESCICRLWSSPVVYLLRGLKSWNAYRHRSKHHGYELLTCVRLCQVIDQACWHTISDIVLRACLCVCVHVLVILTHHIQLTPCIPFICRLQFILSISAKCHWARHRTFALPLGAWNLASRKQFELLLVSHFFKYFPMFDNFLPFLRQGSAVCPPTFFRKQNPIGLETHRARCLWLLQVRLAPTMKAPDLMKLFCNRWNWWIDCSGWVNSDVRCQIISQPKPSFKERDPQCSWLCDRSSSSFGQKNPQRPTCKRCRILRIRCWEATKEVIVQHESACFNYNPKVPTSVEAICHWRSTLELWQKIWIGPQCMLLCGC